MTRSIDETVHAEIQMILWRLIEEQGNEGMKLDYLQVLELTVADGRQRIVHRQEEPERKREWLYTLQYTIPIEQTIWCIDSEAYKIMLLPKEY